jgi:hypothetical protein
MLKKTLLYIAPVATTLGPVAYYSGPEWVSSISAPSAQSPAGIPELPPADPTMPGPDGAALVLPPPPTAPLPTPMYDVADVLRFDVGPSWVIQSWPRVSTGLGQLDLHGYRVPLVTGTAEDDLAGALTYYFNSRQQVQRITFKGTTGSAAKLISVVTGRFGFARRLTNDPGVFIYEVKGPDRQVKSTLWIRPAGVLEMSKNLSRFEVALTLERPETG